MHPKSKCRSSSAREAGRAAATWEKGLPLDEQARSNRAAEWSLEAWLYWLEQTRREWFWWDAKALDDIDHIMVAVEVDGWPFPWNAVRWLFKAAGASDLKAEE